MGSRENKVNAGRTIYEDNQGNKVLYAAAKKAAKERAEMLGIGINVEQIIRNRENKGGVLYGAAMAAAKARAELLASGQ